MNVYAFVAFAIKKQVEIILDLPFGFPINNIIYIASEVKIAFIIAQKEIM